MFQSTTTEDAYSVEAEVHSGKKNIHGYTWSLADSSTNPAIYNYGDGHGPVPFGNFNGGTGDFSGKMPGQDAAVKYGYQVDRSNPNAKSAFTVKYVTENGTVVIQLTYKMFSRKMRSRRFRRMFMASGTCQAALRREVLQMIRTGIW